MEVTETMSCDLCWHISKDNPIMKITTNISRIKAHDYNTTKLPTVDVDQNENQNDGISPNPIERENIKYIRYER